MTGTAALDVNTIAVTGEGFEPILSAHELERETTTAPTMGTSMKEPNEYVRGRHG
jgi:hypothetical protein